ncbi:MAG: protein kinase [Pseudomonadota bacterium]
MTLPTYSHALASGTQLLWYRIERVLAQGGFGVTYLARDLNLDIKVAIKEYLPNDLAVRVGDSVQAKADAYYDDYIAGRKRFVVEGQALAEFDHPHIVKVHTAFEANDTAYIVMRYESGRDLNRLLEAGQKFSEAEIKELLMPVLDGLEAVHAKKWIHRDIKPGNIIVREGTRHAVLTDFGAARMDYRGASRAVTTLISVGYSPLEQFATQRRHQGPWSDIYAMGATAYHMVVGEKPLSAEERGLELLTDGRDQVAERLDEFVGAYSASFINALKWALRLEHNERPASARAWRRALRGHESTESTTSPALAPHPLRTAKRWWLRARRYAQVLSHDRRAPWAVGVVGAMATVSVLAALHTQATERRMGELLSEADHLAEQKVFHSETGNDAVTRYRAVLALEPTNEAARIGLRAIGARYLAEAKRAGARGDATAAGLMIARARDAAPDHPEIDSTAEYLALSAEEGPAIRQAQELITLGDEALATAEPAKALAAYRRALSEEAPELRLRAQDGILAVHAHYVRTITSHLDQGSLESARSLFSDATQAFPEDPQILPLGTVIEDRLAREEALLAQERQVESLVLSAEVLFADGKLIDHPGDNALELYYEALAHAPDNEGLRARINQIIDVTRNQLAEMIESKAYADAQALYDKAIAILPNDPVIGRLGGQLERLSREDRVAVLLTRAGALLDKGRALDPEGDDALARYLAVLELQPSQPEANDGVEAIRLLAIKRIETDAQAGDFESAYAIYLSAKRLPATEQLQTLGREVEIQVLLSRAKKRIQTQDWVASDDNALSLYQRVLSLDSSNQAAIDGKQRVFTELHAHVSTLLANGDIGAAKEAVAAGLDNFSNAPMLHELRGQVRRVESALARERRIASLLAAAQALELDPMQPSRSDLGVVAYYRQVLELDPFHTTARKKLAQYLEGVRRTANYFINEGHLDRAQSLMANAEAHFAGDPNVQALAAEVSAKARRYSHNERVLALVSKGTEHLRHDRLTAPAGDNAYVSFRRALAIEPDNPAAQRGIRKIVDRYLVLAQRAQSAGRTARAQSFLARASTVAPESKEVARAKRSLSEPDRATVRYRDDGLAAGAKRKTLLDPAQKYLDQVKGQIHNAASNIEQDTFSETMKAFGRKVMARLSPYSDEAKITAALAAGQEYLAAAILVTDGDNNAMAQFQRVVSLDPNHPDGKQGLQDTKDQLVYQVESLLARREFEEAERLQRLAERIVFDSAPFVRLAERIEHQKATLASYTPDFVPELGADDPFPAVD